MATPKNVLYQPIMSREPEPGHVIQALTLDRVLELLKLEEDYYPGDQNKTKLMFTRLRKVYYDSWGWTTQVIRGAKDIPGRYGFTMKAVPSAPSTKVSGLQGNKHDTNFQPVTMSYVVVYKADDRVYPERAGQIPEIYEHDNQELILPEGFYCDIGHVFSGLDAYAYLAPISPLPNFLMWMRKLFPSVDSNVDFSTWLGDVASAAGDYLFEVLASKKLNREDEQDEIDRDVPASDMLGNIDPYVILKNYPTTEATGPRVTEILKDYYYGTGKSKGLRNHRFSIFCDSIGLKGWDGNKFSNEAKWMKYYKKQLRAATIFYVVGDLGLKKGAWIAFKMWLRFYEKELALELLLQILLDALKEQIKKEPSTKK